MVRDPGSVEVWKLDRLWQAICFSSSRERGETPASLKYIMEKKLKYTFTVLYLEFKKRLMLPMLFFFSWQNNKTARANSEQNTDKPCLLYFALLHFVAIISFTI